MSKLRKYKIIRTYKIKLWQSYNHTKFFRTSKFYILETDLYFIFLSIILKPVTIGFYLGAFGVLFLLISSALISGSEVAFFSLSPSQIFFLREKNKDRRNKLIIEQLAKPEKLLATILIANNFINIGIVILSSYVINSIFDFTDSQLLGFIFQVVIITFLLLLFGEILPKVYASNSSLKFALFTIYLLSFLSKIFNPVSFLLIKTTAIAFKKKKRQFSVQDLSDAFELTKSSIKKDKKILESIVSFGNTDVTEIMKPRVDVVDVDSNFGFKKLIQIIIDSGYSRMPVYQETPDNIKGVLYIKDLLPHIEKDNNFKWHELIREPYFVPETMKIDNLLEEFQTKKIHLAIVTDEYGGVLGIATLEDILEEIIGEITDEYDDNEVLYKKIDANNYILDGKFQLNDLYKITSIEDNIFEKIRGEADSIAGLILEIEGRIPEKGDIVRYKKFIFEIIAADKRKIEKIKLKINES